MWFYTFLLPLKDVKVRFFSKHQHKFSGSRISLLKRIVYLPYSRRNLLWYKIAVFKFLCPTECYKYFCWNLEVSSTDVTSVYMGIVEALFPSVQWVSCCTTAQYCCTSSLFNNTILHPVVSSVFVAAQPTVL